MEIIIDKIYFHVIDLWIKLYIHLKSTAVKENNSESNTGMLWHLFLMLKKNIFYKVSEEPELHWINCSFSNRGPC